MNPSFHGCAARVRRASASALALIALLSGCGGGGSGSDAPQAQPLPSVPVPAAGIYLDAGSPSSQTRPSLVVVVNRSNPGDTPTWVAWQALDNGDTRLYAGLADAADAQSSVRYVDATTVQSGSADLRTSLADRLQGTVNGVTQALNLQTRLQAADRLLTLDDLTRITWAGDWRHHSAQAGERGVSSLPLLQFTSSGGGQLTVSPAQITLLNCYVSAKLSEQAPSSPGLFKVTLVLSAVPGAGSPCGHAGTFEGLAAGFRYGSTTGVAQFRLMATDDSGQKAISFVAGPGA